MDCAKFVGLLLGLAQSAVAQSAAELRTPEPGLYRGYTTSSNVTATLSGSGRPGTPVQYGVNSNLGPSVFGDLILNSNGTYRLTRAGETGRWSYDGRTGLVTFTGRLSIAEVRYNYEPDHLNFQIVFPYNSQKISLSFSKKRERAYIRPTNPNRHLAGTLIVEGNGQVVAVDLEKGAVGASFPGSNPSANTKGEVATLRSSGGYTDVLISDGTGRLLHTISGQAIYDSKEIDSYRRVAISPSGEYLLLSGETDGWRKGSMASRVDLVIDRTGNSIASFAPGVGRSWAGSWTADGRALVSDGEALLLFSPADRRKTTVLAAEAITAARLSPDGTRLLILNAENRLTVKPLAGGASTAWREGAHDAWLGRLVVTEIGWTPDGRSVMLTAQSNDFFRYRIGVLPADGDPFFLADADGKPMVLAGLAFSWYRSSPEQ